MRPVKHDRSQNPKIAFVIGLQVPFEGAAWRRIGFFARYLSLKKFNVYIISPRVLYIACSVVRSRNSEVRGESLSKIITVPLKLHICKSPFLTSIFEIVNSLLLGIVLCLIKPEVIILSVPPYRYLIGTYLASRLSRAKLIVDLRDPIDISYVKYIKRKGLRILIQVVRSAEYSVPYRASAITCVSESMARDVSRALPYLSTKMHLVPNGADLTIFKPLKEVKSREPGVFKLFFMGNALEGYNLSVVLKALSILRNERLSVKLYIAGALDLKLLYAEAKKLGVLDSIEYLGSLTADRLVSTMNDMSLAVLPYYNEKNYRHSLPAKFYEYIACGLPVLVSAPPYFEVAKIVRGHGVGIWCPAEDISCIVNAIKQLYKDKNKLMALVERCLSLRSSINRVNSVKKLINIIKGFINNVTP